MANIEGAGGAEEWDIMNQKNQKMVAAWMKSGATQIQQKFRIEMVEVVE